MSDPNFPQHSAPAAPVDPAHSAPAAPVHSTPAASAPGERAEEPKKLSTFLKVSIILLAGLTVASISLLFIGDFEGKFERVFSTFVLFAVFVLLTQLDTRREMKSEWYAPVALIANAYILGLLLIVIWLTPYDPYELIWEIFWKSVFVILITRLVILCCQLLLSTGTNLPEIVTRFAFVTSVLAVLSGILFTAPVGIETFDLYIPDLYWKIAVAMLILTALGLSITLLLRWSFGSHARDAARASGVAPYPAAPPYIGAPGQQLPQVPQVGVPAGQPSQPGQPGMDPMPAAAQPTTPLPEPGAPVAPAEQGGQRLLPWPTFPDGRPLPMGPDGQPDFSALRP
ncbi:MAG: hypothetical protein ACK5LO_17380 [Leucobacter sp.]